MRYSGTVRLLAVATVVALAALASRDAARGQEGFFTVNATHDAVDAAPRDGVCADAGGACTLRAAVMEANAVPGFNSIAVMAGTFVLTIPGTGEDAALRGDLDITGWVTITGADTPDTIIDGGGIDRVFDIDPVAAGGFNAALTFMTIRNGSTTAASGTADDRGGGILNRGSAAILFGVVADNEAGAGGGVFNEGNFETAGENEFRNNRAVGTPASAGGGIYNEGTLEVSQGIIDGNSSSRGGGIFNMGEATVRGGTTISGNTATISGGGIENEGTITIRETTISGNSLAGFSNPGSEVAPGTVGNATVTNSTISGNFGGIGNGGTLALTNVTIAENSTVGLGAGTIGSVSMKNTIVGQNGAGDCTPLPGITSLGHNLDSDGTCGLTGSGDISNVDPKLGPLADNGGTSVPRTRTHALLARSPAIDTADNAACPVSDQRFFPRPVDGNGDGSAVCDIGAFEADAVAATPAPTPTATPVSPIDLPSTGGDARSSPNAMPLAVVLGAGATIVAAGGVMWRARRRHNADEA
jgi:CSLREA domain-containing protein